MKIIQQGKMEKLMQTKRFTCGACGCIFEAGKEEYKAADYWAAVHDNISASCKCPCCGNTAYVYGE